ncbi:MAG TPA: methyltransferase domain-containing protein [Candidatus Nanoarchaeia archaeon]|nr:methyltransferase domain-containing protein [Candidatus Nanoarchaeia archaeon]
MENKKRLNLGCGYDYRKDWINVDNDRKKKADLYFNIDKYPYPFKKEEFDHILASHIVEHLENPFRFMDEIKRILKKDGVLEIIVPHCTNIMAFDPQHRTYYSYKSMNHLSNDFEIKEIKLVFTPKYKFMEIFARKFPLFYENTPLRVFPAKEIRTLFRKKNGVK